MRSRFLISGIMLFALLVGAWGNVLAAALCTKMASGHSCCLVQGAPQTDASHDGMADMQMGDMQMPPEVKQEITSNLLTQPEAECEHCMSHSSLATGPNTLREADQIRSSENVAAPLASADQVSLSPSFVPQVNSKQHAPPGATASKYVLFSIFRI